MLRWDYKTNTTTSDIVKLSETEVLNRLSIWQSLLDQAW